MLPSRDEKNLFLVGDVKQSIYGFRQAMPEIFLARRARCTAGGPEGGGFPMRVTLGENFRSRREVTDAVNFVFSQLMSAECGGVDYAAGEALIAAAKYEDAPDCQTSLLVAESDESADKTADEARMIAVQIRRLVDSGTYTYKDCCILLRSVNPHAAVYAETLTRCGMPVAGQGGGFFEAAEIQTAISLLRAVDNPLLDVPLLAALCSPVFGFSADELAALRMNTRGGGLDSKEPVYLSLRRCAESGETENGAEGGAGQGTNKGSARGPRRVSFDASASAADILPAESATVFPPVLSVKCRGVLRRLADWRIQAATLPADRLLQCLYDDTGLPLLVAVRTHGAARQANLWRLHGAARRFESDGFRGLAAFVRYLDRLEAKGTFPDEAEAVSSADNAVRLMSIHKAKGLEFPVVFVAGLARKFNMQGTRGPLLLHGEMGVGLDRRDAGTLCQWHTLAHTAAAMAIWADEREEELRILYVAMTRAKERLFLTMAVPDLAMRLRKAAAALGGGNAAGSAAGNPLPAHMVRAVSCAADWILMAALRHPSADEWRQRAGAENLQMLPCDTPWRIETFGSEDIPKVSLAAPDDIPAEADAALIAALRERIDFVYPYAEDTLRPSKLAASELAGAHAPLPERPAYLQGGVHSGGRGAPGGTQRGARLTPAERGTALHAFLQYADFEAAARDVEREAGRLVERRFLTPEQAASIPAEKAAAFFASPLYRRLAASPRVWREAPFTIETPEGTLIQGIADCAFEEDGALVLIDYKTDKVKKGEELAERYAEQLRLYQAALTQTLGMPVKESWIYGFEVGAVRVE
ncbi:MAG: PD-(D/E)XK nuclease family protein [Oscillospiraceae bacterium]|nr:PD-(D/E)XK nuclease family protein [Oscillospiraceae bacterium]